MARYLDQLYQGLLGTNFGNAGAAAQNMMQQGEAQAQQAAQIGRQREAEMQQAAAMSEQAEAQRQAEEARRRQAVMQIGMMLAGGGLGGGEAAAGEAAGTNAAIDSAAADMAAAPVTNYVTDAMAATPSSLAGEIGKGAQQVLNNASWWDKNKQWVMPTISLLPALARR